jgi:cysteine desulfurase
MIYLDNNATTAVDARVRQAMLPYLGDCYGNPSSMHRFGQESRQAIEHARHQVAKLLGCQGRELIFTSGGSEADNAAIHGVLAARPGKKTIVTSTVEHSAVREPLQYLAKQGFRVTEVPVDDQGRLDMNALDRGLQDPDVALLTAMWANNETGVVFDVAQIGALARHRGVPFHVDAVQAAGKLPIHFAELPIDLLSISGHKFHGPKGAGALVVRRGVRWQPFVRGGPQERDRRGGTENVPGIVGMGAAAEIAGQLLDDPAAWRAVAALRDQLEREITAQIPDTHVNGTQSSRLPNTTNIGFAGLEAEAILLLLSEQDICASAGAACSSGSLEPSHVLTAMHLPDRIAHGAVRFSLSPWTNVQDVQHTLEVLPRVIERLRAVLPVG